MSEQDRADAPHPELVTGDPADAPPPLTAAQRQQLDAMRAIENIFERGANPGQEALRLANDFTDRQTRRLSARIRRRGRDAD